MKEFKRVFSLKMLLFLVVLAVVSFAAVRLSFHYSDGFKESYNDLIDELSGLSAQEQKERVDTFTQESFDRSLAYLYYSAGSDELRNIYAQMAAENIGEDWQEYFSSLDLSDEAMDRFYSDQQAFSVVSAQVEHLSTYQDYLDTVHENARQMSSLSIFNKDGKNGFSMRNLKRTDADFPQGGEIDTVLTNTLSVEGLINDKTCGICLLIWMLAVVLCFMHERRSSLHVLVYSMPGGRGALARKRILILLFASVLGTFLICGASFSSLIQLYGTGDFEAAVQSSSLFKTFTSRMDLRQFLLLFFALKALGMWAVSLLVFLMIQAIDHLHTALAAAGVFLVVEYSLFAYIPDSYTLAILRFINIFAFVEPGRLFLKYLNLNIFGYPVRGALLSAVLVPVVAVLSMIFIVIHSERSHPVSRDNIFVRVCDRIRTAFSAKAFHSGLFVCELKKVLWHQRGLVTVALLLVWCFVFAVRPPVDTEMFDTDLAALQAEYQGEVSENTVAAVQREIDKVNAMEDSELKFEKLELLEKLQDEIHEKAGTGRWIINPAPISAITNRSRQYQRTNAAAELMAVVLLCAGIFAYENQNSTVTLLRSTPLGRGCLVRKKIVCAVIFAFIVWLLVSARELYLCVSYFETEIPLSAPVRSIAFFEKLPDVSVGIFLAVYYLIKLVALVLAALISCLVSKFCKTVNASLVICFTILVLPVLISVFGLESMDMISLSKLLSPCEFI